MEYSFKKTIVTWLGRDVRNFSDRYPSLKQFLCNAKNLCAHFEILVFRFLQWELPSMGDSVPSGCLGVSYMDGKVWLDVRGLTGERL